MEKNRQEYYLQEILFGTEDKAESKRINALVKKGYAKKIAPRVYTTNLEDSPEVIIKRNWFKILAKHYEDALFSHRSAIECKPTPEGHIYLTYSYSRKVVLPGLIIHLQEGPERIDGDNSFYDGLFRSQEARAYLENLQQTRKQGQESKTLAQEQIEAKLEAIIRVRGNDGLNALRDRARIIAPQLGLENEFEKLNRIVSALLATHPSKTLSSSVAKARALGEPFDPARIRLFESLYNDLTDGEFPSYPERNKTLKAYQNFAFYEGYFSNYIEGTILTIEDAKQVIARRHLQTYQFITLAKLIYATTEH